MGIGLWIGAFEVAVTAVAARSGAATLAAVPLSAMAAGSILVSLWSGTGRLNRPAAWRYLVGCVIVAAALPLTLLLVPLIAGITTIAVLVGTGFALLNVALFELLDSVVAADRAVEAFTWLTTGNAAGTAGGAALAGQLRRQASMSSVVIDSIGRPPNAGSRCARSAER